MSAWLDDILAALFATACIVAVVAAMTALHIATAPAPELSGGTSRVHDREPLRFPRPAWRQQAGE